VKRELLIAIGIGAATIAVAGVAGCSNDNKSSGTSSSATSSSATSSATSSGATTSSSAAPVSGSDSSEAAPAIITIGGQPKTVDGPVVCSTTDGKFSIAIGEMITGVIVGLEPDASAVHNVGLGDVNGVVLSFTEGVPGNDATAIKDGNNYTITGTATGSDNANQQVSKPFEIDVTCP
jgi:lipoprotein LpqH